MNSYSPPTEVDFHFDVMCPWAYQTSLWMRDVRDQLDLKVNWKFFSLEEGVRRITSDTADLFGLVDRGRIAEGAYADINVIDFEKLSLTGPEYVHDFPGGAGRYIQRGAGYDATIVNGKVFMEDGEHTGELAGVTLRSTD